MLTVDAIAEKLDTKLSKWKPEISQEVRALLVARKQLLGKLLDIELAFAESCAGSG